MSDSTYTQTVPLFFLQFREFALDDVFASTARR